jgi:hypothetical protein
MRSCIFRELLRAIVQFWINKNCNSNETVDFVQNIDEKIINETQLVIRIDSKTVKKQP